MHICVIIQISYHIISSYRATENLNLTDVRDYDPKLFVDVAIFLTYQKL